MSGYIYFIYCSELSAMKIGFTTKNPEARLKQLQTGSPVTLHMLGWITGEQAYEQELHERLAAIRMSGEWFNVYSDEDLFNNVMREPLFWMRLNNHLYNRKIPVFGVEDEEPVCG